MAARWPSWPLLAVLLLVAPAIVQAEYPQNALQCHSSNTLPNQKVICPEDENGYCVKIVDTRKERNCGRGDYFFDRWKGGQCLLKKCATECVEDVEMYYQDDRGLHPDDDDSTGGFTRYYRTTYCCKDKDFCNGASSFPRAGPLATALAVSVLAAATLCSLALWG